MKKLLLLLLCVPLLFSCGEKEENDNTENTEKQEENDTDNLQREVTQEMMNDGYTGKGTYIWKSGSKYVGEWKNSYMHGQGTFTFGKDSEFPGDKYIGEQKYGKKDGQGTYTYSNGDRYIGELKNDLLHGQGTYTYYNGDTYEGEWIDGEEQDYGLFINGTGAFKGETYVG